MADAITQRATPLRLRLSRDDLIQGGGLVAMALFLVVAMLLPLYWILSKSLEDRDGNFIGLANYIKYFSTPALVTSAENTIPSSPTGDAQISRKLSSSVWTELSPRLQRSRSWVERCGASLHRVKRVAPFSTKRR